MARVAETVVISQPRTKALLRAAVRFSSNNIMGAIGLVALLFLVIVALAAPVLAPYDPRVADFKNIAISPNSEHLFGTDGVGRDVLSRLIFGSRVSLAVAFVAVGIGTTVGGAIGLFSGYKGGRIDLLIQRFLEIMLAFPGLILALLLVVALGFGMGPVIIALAVTRIPVVARVIRSVALQAREMDFVIAARAIGASELRIMVQHVAPQCVAPYLVLFSAALGVAIVVEASLGFLGLGVPPPTPTWGNMLSEATLTRSFNPIWWLVVFPGIAISITVIAANLAGDAIRDTLDPRLRGRI